MTGIFISYRREDTAPWAGRIYERLAHEFSRGQLFMDVDNIAPGLDFVQVLEEQVAACDALLVLIGRDWVEAKNASGHRRLDDPNDFVRIEVEAALRRNVRVVPILVDGAPMPPHEVLPESLRPLLRRNAVELTHARFGTDVKRLTDALAPLIKKVDANEQNHQANPAIQLLDGVVFEGAALEHWESIKGTTDPKRLLEFLAGYGKSRMGRLGQDALQRLATTAWRKVNKRSESALISFIDSYPDTAEIADANATKAALEAAREQARALAMKKSPAAAEAIVEASDQSRTRGRWVNRLAWASLCFALLLFAALLLAVPSLRPALPPNLASPAARPPSMPVKTGVDRAPASLVPGPPSPPPSEPLPTQAPLPLAPWGSPAKGAGGDPNPPRPFKEPRRPMLEIPPSERAKEGMSRTDPLSNTKQ
jgi:hypothetical protein